MTLNVEVTEEDILLGDRGNCSACPIARAVRRTTKKKTVRVGNWAITIGRTTYKLPKVAQGFIGSFDCGASVKPFKFSLEVNR